MGEVGRVQEEGWEGGSEGGKRREGAMGWWGREGTREGESKGREVGSNDARQAERVSGGRGDGGREGC